MVKAGPASRLVLVVTAFAALGVLPASRLAAATSQPASRGDRVDAAVLPPVVVSGNTPTAHDATPRFTDVGAPPTISPRVPFGGRAVTALAGERHESSRTSGAPASPRAPPLAAPS